MLPPFILSCKVMPFYSKYCKDSRPKESPREWRYRHPPGTIRANPQAERFVFVTVVACRYQAKTSISNRDAKLCSEEHRQRPTSPIGSKEIHLNDTSKRRRHVMRLFPEPASIFARDLLLASIRRPKCIVDTRALVGKSPSGTVMQSFSVVSSQFTLQG